MEEASGRKKHERKGSKDDLLCGRKKSEQEIKMERGDGEEGGS